MANLSGTTHLVRALAEEQATHGHEVGLWYVERPGQPPELPDPALVSSREFALSLPFMNPGASLPFARAIGRGVEGFDVVHIHAIWNLPTLLALRAAVRRGVPVVVAPQGSLDPWALRYRQWKKTWYTRHVELPWIRRASCVQALTRKEKQQVQRAGVRSPVAVIPNGVRTAEFASLPDASGFRARHGVPAGAPVLLFMGRLHPKKGLDILAKAFAQALREVPEAVLLVAGGDGGSGFGERARGFFREAGVDVGTRFLGEVRGEEKKLALSAADAFVLPSHSEGLPVAILEALASGLPPIISGHANVPEVAEHGAGRVLELDEAAFGAAIAQVLGDAGLRAGMASRCRALAREKFEWRSVAGKTIRLYEKLVERGAKGAKR